MSTQPHAFVVMPFGTKPGANGTPIDFNAVYSQFIQPALQEAGLDPFRADEELRAGDIRTDMFQELLLADLVLADLTIDNPNVWYELGVRHALRSRGVLLISGGKVPTAFDLYTDRKLRYSLRDGVPDADRLPKEHQALVRMLTSTMQSWHGRSVSPVYTLLPNLQEPDWKTLRIGNVCEYWEAHEAWQRRVQLARRENRLGDMLVLADEAPVASLRGEALVEVGKALRQARRYRLAYETLQRGAGMTPSASVLQAELLREQGICLERLSCDHVPGYTLDRVRDHYNLLLNNYPADPAISETHGLAAQVEKQAWFEIWRSGESLEQRLQMAIEEKATLQLSLDSYLKGFRADPANSYTGINALTLMHLQVHFGLRSLDDPQLTTIAGAVRFGAESARNDRDPFFALATLADLEVLTGTAETATDAYRTACARHDSNGFALDSCRAHLLLMRDLGFRSEVVEPAIATLERVIERLNRTTALDGTVEQPRLAILFSGHMMDSPDRAAPRFPAAMESAAIERINAALDLLGAGPEDMAFCQAAAGGDLIFLEAAQRRQVRCQVLLPFDEPTFLQQSVFPSENGSRWRERYYAMRDKLSLPIRLMPEALGPTPAQVNAYERCNLWLLHTAMACGIDRLRFIT
ncbi:MAG: DUF4071 domain-containing protein, partial [Cyanobacteria bacterium]|nr:DUF4071 domain-containing protein [Cyanobacteriota bacterium]